MRDRVATRCVGATPCGGAACSSWQLSRGIADADCRHHRGHRGVEVPLGGRFGSALGARRRTTVGNATCAPAAALLRARRRESLGATGGDTPRATFLVEPVELFSGAQRRTRPLRPRLGRCGSAGAHVAPGRAISLPDCCANRPPTQRWNQTIPFGGVFRRLLAGGIRHITGYALCLEPSEHLVVSRVHRRYGALAVDGRAIVVETECVSIQKAMHVRKKRRITHVSCS